MEDRIGKVVQLYSILPPQAAGGAYLSRLRLDGKQHAPKKKSEQNGTPAFLPFGAKSPPWGAKDKSGGWLFSGENSLLKKVADGSISPEIEPSSLGAVAVSAWLDGRQERAFVRVVVGRF